MRSAHKEATHPKRWLINVLVGIKSLKNVFSLSNSTSYSLS